MGNNVENLWGQPPLAVRVERSSTASARHPQNGNPSALLRNRATGDILRHAVT